MLYFKAFHIIFVVTWFAALFYLPRLFVYHATASDTISLDRFKLMEKRLYYAIAWPGALFTTILGLMLLFYTPSFLKATWMHTKLLLVGGLWIYHGCCGHFLKQFALHQNKKTARFFRFFNEIPTLFLIAIVLLVVVKP